MLKGKLFGRGGLRLEGSENHGNKSAELAVVAEVHIYNH